MTPQDPTVTTTPSVPTEAEVAAKIRALQKLMGIPTDQEVNPLLPGATDQELWPAQPGEQFTDFRIV